MIEIARLGAFVKLGRPHFLVGGFLLFGLGSALAVAGGARIDWAHYAWGQATITAAQWMTHYANDYFDLEADRANSTPTRWSGGSRVLVSGFVAPWIALATSLGLGAVALFAAGVLATLPNSPPWVLPLAVLILALSWFYSAPPIRLLSRGLGEATTALVVTLLTPLLGFYVQAGAVRPVLFLACLPLCALQFSMLLTIELPDAEGDAAHGKRTLVVRRGAAWSAYRSAAILVATYCSLPILFWLGLEPTIALLAALPAPIALWQIMRLSRGAYRDPKHWEGLAFASVALLVTTSVAELVGVVLSIAAKR
jgi:1,4-dihydroxy-2-naphthoate octaprenyltransferase